MANNNIEIIFFDINDFVEEEKENNEEEEKKEEENEEKKEEEVVEEQPPHIAEGVIPDKNTAFKLYKY